jgi:hypothetical protein
MERLAQTSLGNGVLLRDVVGHHAELRGLLGKVDTSFFLLINVRFVPRGSVRLLHVPPRRKGGITCHSGSLGVLTFVSSPRV